jgi:spermidine synthase
MQTSGISLVLDMYDCQSSTLCNESLLTQLFVDALQLAGFFVIDHLSHRFPIQGTTFIYILQQSHAVLHTWPECEFVSIDVYSCGEPEVVRPALEILRDDLARKLEAHSVTAQFISRGA